MACRPSARSKRLLLLGKSLLETQDIDRGIEALQSALNVKPRGGGKLNIATHRLLAEAYSLLPKPDYELRLRQLGGRARRQKPDPRAAGLGAALASENPRPA